MTRTTQPPTGRLGPLLTLVAVIAFVAPGCDSRISDATIKSMISSVNDCNGKRLANLYGMYQQTSGLKGPSNEKALKAFIATVNPAQLDAMGVSAGDVDAIFVSERDGRPFEVRYGVPSVPMTGGHQAVVFESEGLNGRVAVYMTGPKVVEVDAAEVAAFKKGSRDEKGEETPMPPPRS